MWLRLRLRPNLPTANLTYPQNVIRHARLGGRDMKYFAYGSNMNPERMRQRGIKFSKREHAILEGWKLVFNKIASRNPNKGYANIERKEGSIVKGILSLGVWSCNTTTSKLLPVPTFSLDPGPRGDQTGRSSLWRQQPAHFTDVAAGTGQTPPGS